MLPTNHQVPPFIYQETTNPATERAFQALLVEHQSAFKYLLWLMWIHSHFQQAAHDLRIIFTFLCPLPLLHPKLHPFAALQDSSHVQLLTHCILKQSSPQAPILSLQWSTTPAGLMILQIILKCTFDWYSSPGYANSCVQAALSLFTTLPSVIQPANFISTDPILVSIYLMKRFNGIWPHLNP